MRRFPQVVTGVVALLGLMAGCSDESSVDAPSSTAASAPTTTPSTEVPAGPSAEVRYGLYDCGPFLTKLGREMTYFVRLFDDGSMAEVMSLNGPDDVFTALTERRSDDLSTDIGVGPFTVSGDRFTATTTDTLGYRISYDGSVMSPDELRLRAVSSLYDFDEERTCTYLPAD